MFCVAAGKWGKGMCCCVRLVKYFSELKGKTVRKLQGTVKISLQCINEAGIECGI